MRQVGLVAIQQRLDVRDYADLDRLQGRLAALLEDGLRRIPGGLPVLAAFPEDTGTLLAFAEDGHLLETQRELAGAVRALALRHLGRLAWTRLARRVSTVRSLFLDRAPAAHRAYVELFGGLARRYGCYLAAGSAVFPAHRMEQGVPRLLPGREVFNTGYLFGPDGRVVASQRKVHLVELEAEGNLDLSPAPLESLVVAPTAVGRVGMAIWFDAFHADVLQRLRDQGIQILVQPSANPRAWDAWQRDDWVRGSWQAVLEGRGRPRYAVNPMMVGSLFELVFEGQSGIFAAGNVGHEAGYRGRPARPGVVCLAEGWDGPEVLAAVVPHPDEVGG